MNKLYCVKITIMDIVIHCEYFWSKGRCIAYLSEISSDGMEYELVEDNDIHTIYMAW